MAPEGVEAVSVSPEVSAWPETTLGAVPPVAGTRISRGPAGTAWNMSHGGATFRFGQCSRCLVAGPCQTSGETVRMSRAAATKLGKRTGRNAVNDAEQAEVAESDGDVPDDGGKDTPGGKVPYWLSQVPYALVLSALAAGIVVVAAAYFKRGPAIIAGALLLAATFRMFLPKDWIGLLAVRRRWVDLATLVALAVLLIVLAWVAPQLSS